MKIKFILIKFEKSVLFQILEQDSVYDYEYRNFGFKIRSVANPQLTHNVIYIRGYKDEKDKQISILRFDNNDDRDSYYKNVLDLFKKANEKNKV